MNHKANYSSIYFVIAMWIFISSITMPTAQANTAFGGIPEIPQIPAFLPSMVDVPATASSPIDGEWIISAIRKRIRIEGGRAYAVDSWIHLFVLRIEPMMVVIKDISRTGTGQYIGSDLPLMGAWSAQLLPNGTLKVAVAGAFGSVKYNLIPVRLDDQEMFNREKNGEYSTEEVYDDESYHEWSDNEEFTDYPEADEQDASPW